MSSIVNEVHVEEGFIKATFAGLELVISEEWGFINATQLCLLKGKTVYRYNDLQLCRNLKSVLSRCCEDVTEKVKSNVKLDPCLPGTYFHPALLLDLAVWLSPETYVKSAVIINTFFNRTNPRKVKFRSLFSLELDEIATWTGDPRNYRIQYEGLSLQVNNLAWFEISDFCRVRDFEARKDVAGLVEYFRSRSLFNDTHYHPLLFLRLAHWFDLECYPNCARLVFGCNYARLNSLFQSQITAAGVSFPLRAALALDQPTCGVAAAGSSSSSRSTSPSTTNGVEVAGASSSNRGVVAAARATAEGASSVGSAVAACPSTSNGATCPVDCGAPSTSSDGIAPSELDLDCVNWIEDDEDSDDSLDTVDLTDEAETMIPRSEHEKELAQIRSELNRERSKKELALARERKKKAKLELVKKEKREAEKRAREAAERAKEAAEQARQAAERERSKDDTIEDLQQKLAGLNIGHNDRGRRKRTYADSRANAADAIMKEVGVGGLECLVLFVSSENGVYGIRRQFQTIIPIIHKQREKVTKFVAWFVTTNAVLDYNRCKVLVSEKAKKCGHEVRFLQNQMEVEDGGDRRFNLPKAIRSTLRIDLEVIEADVRILGRLFDKPLYHEDDDIERPRAGSSSTFLDRIHRWFEAEHASYMSLLGRREQRRNGTNRR